MKKVLKFLFLPIYEIGVTINLVNKKPSKTLQIIGGRIYINYQLFRIKLSLFGLWFGKNTKTFIKTIVYILALTTMGVFVVPNIDSGINIVKENEDLYRLAVVALSILISVGSVKKGFSVLTVQDLTPMQRARLIDKTYRRIRGINSSILLMESISMLDNRVSAEDEKAQFNEILSRQDIKELYTALTLAISEFIDILLLDVNDVSIKMPDVIKDIEIEELQKVEVKSIKVDPVVVPLKELTPRERAILAAQQSKGV